MGVLDFYNLIIGVSNIYSYSVIRIMFIPVALVPLPQFQPLLSKVKFAHSTRFIKTFILGVHKHSEGERSVDSEVVLDSSWCEEIIYGISLANQCMEINDCAKGKYCEGKDLGTTLVLFQLYLTYNHDQFRCLPFTRPYGITKV